MQVPQTMTEPRTIPERPEVPEQGSVLADIISWYESYISDLEKAAELAEKDKAAIRKWSDKKKEINHD